MPKPPPPTPFIDLPLQTRRDIRQLAASPAARALVKPDASRKALHAAAQRYIAKAQQLALPPELWRVECEEEFSSDRALRPPLPLLYLKPPSSPVELAAEAFITAGCPLFAGDWALPRRGLQFALMAREPLALAQFVLSGHDTPAQRVFLRAALRAPDTPRAFVSDLRLRFKQELRRDSGGPGVWGPGDHKALVASSILSDCAAELIESSGRRLWGSDELAAHAARLVALKNQPDPFGLKALRRAASPERRERLRALTLLTQQFPHDQGLLTAALEATPWLAHNPNLACLAPPASGPSLFSSALSHNSPLVLAWLARIGANPWLACAQELFPNPVRWTLESFPRNVSDASLGSMAASLISGSSRLGGEANAWRERLMAFARDAFKEACEHQLDPSQTDLAARFVASLEAQELRLAAAAPSAPPARSARL